MAYDLRTMKVADKSGECDERLYEMLPARWQRRGMLFHATACPEVGGSSLNFLLNYHEPVSSANQLIARDGTIYNLVPAHAEAYHSGPAIWEGYQDPDTSLNASFYGVEIENTNDGREPYTREQIVSAAASYAYHCALHKWRSDRALAKHYEVAIYSSRNTGNKALWGKYGRKSDPYMFPWRQFYDVLRDIRADWPVDRFGVALWVPGQP